MEFHVNITISLKGGMLDPEARAIQHALSNLGFETGDLSTARIYRISLNAADAEVKNLTMINPDINGGDNGIYVGAVVGYLPNGTISNCTVIGGSVRGKWFTGALTGNSNGQIDNCHVSSKVQGEYWTGGLVGIVSSGLIQNCSSRADVYGSSNTGGLVDSRA